MDLRETLREQLGKTGRMLLGVTGDVTEEEGAARPQGLAPIVWQVGHVTYYDALLVQEVLGGPLEVPEQYGAWFKQGSSGQGDFPPLADVRAAAERVHARVLELVDRDLAQPLDGGPAYSDLGGALMFTLVHRSWHTGKIMTLRALVGKPIMF